jgi:hypothetical protein
VLYNGDLGWGIGTHIGRVYRSDVRGWIFVSTYDDAGTGWASNQLFFVELVDSTAGPRVFRVSPTINAYDEYWTEAFASLDFASQHVWWGANWNGTDNQELYRATLCDRWWEAM